VGAPGAVGSEFLRIAEQRYAKLPKLKLLASSRSAGRRISVGGKELVVEAMSALDARLVDEHPREEWTTLVFRAP